jgi:hypothetical protein
MLFEINPTWFEAFSSFNQLHYFHYEFVMLANCSKCKHSWHDGFVILAPQNK